MAEEAAGTPTAEEAATAATAVEDGGSADKTFTQDELNSIVQDRLARAAKGLPSKEELKALTDAKAELEKIQQAGASDLEKANKARETAEAKATAAIATANERLLRASVLAEAAKQGVTKAELLFKALDHGALTIDDDGEVSGVTEAVKAFVDENPEFVGKAQAGSADQGARGGGPDQITRAELAKLPPEQAAKLLSEGKLNHLLA